MTQAQIARILSIPKSSLSQLVGMLLARGYVSYREHDKTYQPARRIFDAYADAGGNFIDTANGYQEGQSEEFRLKTDRIDLYWAHVDDGVTPLEEIALEKGGTEWLSYGRDYSEQRFSPLSGINEGNVSKLGLTAFVDLGENRGQEATPLMADGVLFTSLSWSKVMAVDAATGKVLWRFDPEVPKGKAIDACCDSINRGVALWEGKVFIGTLDGRLIALDAKTGKKLWDEQTTDPTQAYTITGAPRVVKGKVIIGNGGGDYATRGYFSAYDANTGKMVWRFYVVPGDPSKPYESPALAEAAKTWKGDAYWKLGGGGNPWDGMSYDPKLDLLYVAEKFGKVTWADRVDMKTGRPVENPAARYIDKPVVQWPSGFGAHNWHPMSYSPITGLVYIPYHEVPGALRNQAKEFVYRPHRFNTGNGFSDAREFPKNLVQGALLAWDPIVQKARWSVPHPNYYNGGVLSTAGNLVIQGNARGHFNVYTADKGKELWDFDAQTGIVAGPMSYELNGEQYIAVMAGWGGAAATVGGEAAQVDGRWNNSRLLIFKLGGTAQLPAMQKRTARPEIDTAQMSMDIPASTDPKVIEEGAVNYANNCLACHGVGAMSGGLTPDLRKSDPAVYAALEAIVLKGALEPLGMPNFGKYLTTDDLDKIKAYLVHRRIESFANAKTGAKASSTEASPK
eukprot:gene3425-3353_t